MPSKIWLAAPGFSQLGGNKLNPIEKTPRTAIAINTKSGQRLRCMMSIHGSSKPTSWPPNAKHPRPRILLDYLRLDAQSVKLGEPGLRCRPPTDLSTDYSQVI